MAAAVPIWAQLIAGLGPSVANFLFGRSQEQRTAANVQKDYNQNTKGYLGGAEAEYQSQRAITVAQMRERGYSEAEINSYWPVKMPAGTVTTARFGGGPAPQRAAQSPQAQPSFGQTLFGAALNALPIVAGHGGSPDEGFQGGTDTEGTHWNTPPDVAGSHSLSVGSSSVSSKTSAPAEHVDASTSPPGATPVGKGIGSIGDYIYVPGRGLVLRSSLGPGDLAAAGQQQPAALRYL